MGGGKRGTKSTGDLAKEKEIEPVPATFHKDTLEWVNQNLLDHPSRNTGRMPTPLARRALKDIFVQHDLDEDGVLSLRELDKVKKIIFSK